MIDRQALVTRHNPVLRAQRPADGDVMPTWTAAPLSVGNGEFAFTADFTGLQTLRDQYQLVPLCTMSQWGWHSFPGPWDETHLRPQIFDTHGRPVGYLSDPTGQREIFDHLRQSPHRLHLGALGFVFRNPAADGRQAILTDYTEVEQVLDLWQGVLRSSFRVFGQLFLVETTVDPQQDALAIRIQQADSGSARGQHSVRLAFPYGSPDKAATDWTAADRHQTSIQPATDGWIHITRVLDAARYHVATQADGGTWRQTQAHTMELLLEQAHVTLVVAFGEQPPHTPLPSFAQIATRAAAWWHRFWSRGGALQLRDSLDPRAGELERRVVLSQYLTAIQCAGSMPPAETGLTCNSWYGKFHLEMHPWHAAHFPLWGRPELLERSMDWYLRILPVARQIAADQGYRGARWPKMTDPSGRNTPSTIAVLLAWQQPHPILLAELLYQAHPTRETLEKYQVLVQETADFMVSFAHLDEDAGRRVLGPPLIPVQETHKPEITRNPPFELAYFQWGLQLADSWRNRLRKAHVGEDYLEAARQLSPLPLRDGAYIAHERCPHTFTRAPFNRDHPAMLGALGFVPGEHADPAYMRATLERVLATWDRESMWGWDFPMMAMTCVRLGLPDLAIDLLMMDTPKNRYLLNGHNPQSTRQDLPLYLPGNGGLLLATAMMTAGCNLVYGQCDWRPDRCVLPGFPDNGRWTVEAEGLRPYL